VRYQRGASPLRAVSGLSIDRDLGGEME